VLAGNILYILYSSISIGVPALMAYLFWRRRSTNGASAMSLLMICEVVWSLSFFLSALSIDMQLKLFLNSFSFVAAAIMPVAWFIFSFQYTRQEKFSKKLFGCLLCVIPIITIFIVFTNSTHHLFMAKTIIKPLPNSSLHLVSYDFGPLFWVHAVYSYILLALGAIILVAQFIGSFKIYRRQALLILGALIVSFSGEIVYQLGLGPFNNILITPFTFSLGGVLLFISMFRYKALDLVPIAYKTVIEIMGDLVIVMDKQHRIIDANNAAVKILGKEHSTLIGQPIGSILMDIPSMADKAALNSKSRSEIILEINHKRAYFNVKLSPLYDKDKSLIGTLLILSDITDLYETMEKLEKERLLAESASKAKSEFLATMSHEIRTPINGIVGMAELLESANLTVQESENLKALQYSAESLLHLITDILDFSKIEAGKMEVEYTNFSLREIVAGTANTFAAQKKGEMFSFSAEVEVDVPDQLLGDYIKLRQILANLLSNAFKFTEKGEVRLKVSKTKTEPDSVWVSFSISDTGIGIAQDKINSLFLSFHQLDSSTTRRFGGTGLGLSIVKKLLDLMGGSIGVKSAVGKGSEFCFELSFKISEKQISDDFHAEASAAAESKSLRILVAEDSRVNQLLISQLLQKKNWDSVIVENGQEALRKLEDNSFDLILMDIQMPVMDGYEAVKLIRQREAGKGVRIPIIALTANATQEDRARCIECGMDDFLTKPIKSDKLYQYIVKYTNNLV